MDHAKRPSSTVFAATIVGLVALAVYFNALPNGLHVDDQQQIVENDWIKDPAYLGEIFRSGVWDHAGRVSSYYRPFMYVLYMAIYLVFGVEPVAFHLLNVLVHAGASVLVVLTTWRILDDGPHAAVSPFVPSLIAGILFATHPIHTEAVAWAAGVADVSYTFFYLLSLYLYILPPDRLRLRKTGSVGAFFVSVLCKEPALTLPVVLLAHDLLLRRKRFSLKGGSLRLLPYVAVAGLYLLLRYNALGGIAPVTTGVSFSPYHYAVNVVFLFSRYLEALVLPVELNFWHVFRPLDSLASPAGIRAVLVVGAFVALSWLAARKSRPALFGSILIFLPLLPSFHVSALNQGLENAFAERYLYLPSFGFVLAAAAWVAWARVSRPRATPVLLAAAVVVATAYSTGTVLRNPVWKDSYSLWSDVIRKSPDSAVAHQSYGFALLRQGKTEQGQKHLALAREMDPDRVKLFVRNAIAYLQRGRTKQAILKFHAALALDPGCAEAHYGLGVVYDQQGWPDMAMGHYESALGISPGHADAHNNLGILYAQREDWARAAEHFEAAVRLNPEHPDYRANLEKLRSR